MPCWVQGWLGVPCLCVWWGGWLPRGAAGAQVGLAWTALLGAAWVPGPGLAGWQLEQPARTSLPCSAPLHTPGNLPTHWPACVTCPPRRAFSHAAHLLACRTCPPCLPALPCLPYPPTSSAPQDGAPADGSEQGGTGERHLRAPGGKQLAAGRGAGGQGRGLGGAPSTEWVGTEGGMLNVFCRRGFGAMPGVQAAAWL